ncbi:glycosylphosphatidylinositol transamidase [Pseudohyphozyma bogoriensis]|nr:glycosylphosphatidylinositol transamidase [Pseudohyphozyma bogoriensis]
MRAASVRLRPSTSSAAVLAPSMMVLSRLSSLPARIKSIVRPTGDPDVLLAASLLRRKATLARLLVLTTYLRTILVFAGFAYLLALPLPIIGQEHHVSENALQPSQVNTYWNWADVHIADLFAEDVAKWSVEGVTSDKRADAIQEAFLKLGLPVATQKYSFGLGGTSRLNGTNVYSILQAPKTDGAEALVLSASWMSRAVGDDGEKRINTRGVAIVLALANYLKKYSMWSKDIIFLLSDGYVDGAHAWLDAYHKYGQSNLEADELSLTTGPIWAAINLDYPYHSFSHVGMFYEGVNGHLPNLDLLNTISHILKHSGIPPILHSDVSWSSPSHSIFTNTPFAPYLDTWGWRQYEQAGKNLARQVLLGAEGRAHGPEGVFGRYRIAGVTLFGVPDEGPHGFHALGRAVESSLRSLNNLLERFHHSFDLYLMKTVDSFISIGSYLAAPILVSAGMTIKGLLLWSQSAAGEGGVKKTRKVGAVLQVMMATHVIGAAVFVVIVKCGSEMWMPFTLYSHAGGPNGWKVAFVLRALGLTYETKFLDFAGGENKGEAYTKINPNGRIPALIDHENDDFTVWESGACLLYLVDHYDKEKKFTVTDPKEKAILDQWLFFQASGQGPYFGQAYHFSKSAPEKIPYAITRYENEVDRVLKVLDSVLSKTEWLVGGKVTIADISFVQWNIYAFAILLPEGKVPEKDYPHAWAWHQKLVDLPFIKEVSAEKAAVATH